MDVPPVDRPDDLDVRQCWQCLAGDAAACTALLQRHEPEIARQMWRFTRDRAVLEELVQEVLVEAYVSLRRYRRQGVPFVHWLRRIATRVGYRYWKRQARSRRLQPLEGVDAPAPPPVLDEPAAAAALLHDLLARLPAADRLVLTLVYFEDCSMQEVADRTGWNLAMVKMRAYRARGRLKKIIDEAHLADTLMEFAHGSA